MKKIKLIHIITGLNGGGAENMLYKVLKFSDMEMFDIEVISMTDKGVYGDRITEELNIPVHTLNIKRGSIDLKALIRCIKLCKNSQVIQCWMYHANLLGFIASKILKKKVVWGLHHSDLSQENNKNSTIVLAKFSAYLSKFCNKVISCGDVVKQVHESIGYYKDNHIVIPNGFDMDLYKPKNDFEKDNSIFEGNFKYLLHVARWDPLKDYENLLSAINVLSNKRSDFRALLVGSEINKDNKELVNLIKKYNVENIVTLLGRREDIPTLMANSDVFISSSIGEGFPNVLGEALSCETLCVSTDTGDCKTIVDRYGKIVPIQNSEKLANAINELLNMDSQVYSKLAQEGRQWIFDNFEIRNIVKKYEGIYKSLR